MHDQLTDFQIMALFYELTGNQDQFFVEMLLERM